MTEVMNSMDSFKVFISQYQNHMYTTEYRTLTYPDSLVLVADGSYVYLTQCPSDAKENKDNWSPS